jgi:hypothetical protein
LPASASPAAGGGSLRWTGSCETPQFPAGRVAIFEAMGNRGLQMAGRAGAMSDSGAINVMDPELALSCARAGQHEGARFILPWAMLLMAVRSETVERRHVESCSRWRSPGSRR